MLRFIDFCFINTAISRQYFYLFFYHFVMVFFPCLPIPYLVWPLQSHCPEESRQPCFSHICRTWHVRLQEVQRQETNTKPAGSTPPSLRNPKLLSRAWRPAYETTGEPKWSRCIFLKNYSLLHKNSFTFYCLRFFKQRVFLISYKRHVVALTNVYRMGNLKQDKPWLQWRYGVVMRQCHQMVFITKA